MEPYSLKYKIYTWNTYIGCKLMNFETNSGLVNLL